MQVEHSDTILEWELMEYREYLLFYQMRQNNWKLTCIWTFKKQ